MKRKIHILFSLCMLSWALQATTDDHGGRYTKEKKVNKEFTVNPGATLKINNSYGDLHVITWNENRTVIEVTFKTSGNDEEKVADKLDELDVVFESDTDLVSARTIFEKNRSRSWWKSWRSNNVNITIDYKIKVPVTNDLHLSNDYGVIYLNETDGNTRLSCDYGRLEIGELRGNDNYLAFDYSKNTTIGYMKGGKINADYSGFIIDRAGDIELVADYNRSEFGEVASINYTCDYGSLSTEASGTIYGRGDYLSLKLGKLSGDLDVTADYGSIRVEELTENAGNVKIRSDYTGIKLGYNPSYSFTFKVTLEYAGLSGKEDLDIVKSRVERSDQYYEGYYGSSNTPNRIDIDSEYGGVSLIKQ